ncbi:MAG: hypothetical protein QM709_11515 [Spongiibacteraceae bacterium]
MSESEILQNVVAAIREAIAEDWVQDFEIDRDTSFNDDLEIESIEFVAIADSLQKKFGDLQLIDWLSKRDINQLIALTVGDVLSFIENRRS